MAAFELAGYEILEKIGEGGMSTVWKARQLSLDRLVAIKTLAASYLPDHEALERFRREAQAAARLNHPGIVQVYDAGEVGGTPYLVMEFVDGCTVADLLERKGRLTEKNALLLAEGVATALGYAWDKDCIIHCDIKPDNVLVEPDGSIKVTDLGLARFIGLHRRHAADETILGTPNYTSPEQAEGVQDLDCRTDIYGLGAMLYHLATGLLPFGDSPGSSAMDRHVNDFLPDPLDLNPDLSHGFAWLVEKMMVKNRAYRPLYWSNVLADIEEVKAGRFPLPPLPEPEQSTILRSAARVALAPHASALKSRTIKLPAAEVASKKRIVVSKRELAGAAAERPRSGPSVGRALLNLLLLLALAGGVYAFLKMGLHERIGLRSRAPETAPEAAAPAVEAAADDDALVIDWGEEPEPVRGMKDGRVVWDNADFHRGAQLFNDALALYEQFQKTRENPASLTRVEAMAREAIGLFNTCRALAPPDVDVAGYINNCYHLIADTRHSTLLSAASKPAPAAEPGPEFQPAPEVPPPSWEAAPRPAPRAVAPAALTLSPVWNKMPLGQRALWEDLKILLSAYGAPAVATEGEPAVSIFQGVTYLMPAREAAQALGATSLLQKRPVECPGFPDRTVYYYALRGDFGDGFDQLLLLVDLADRVVGAQLMNERPAASSLDATHYAERWRTYNFVQSRTKAGRQWRVAHRVRAADGVVAIDSELATADDAAGGPGGKVKERTTLLLPQPIVNLILARLSNAS